jgi:hypothetical protein
MIGHDGARLELIVSRNTFTFPLRLDILKPAVECIYGPGGFIVDGIAIQK